MTSNFSNMASTPRFSDRDSTPRFNNIDFAPIGKAFQAPWDAN